MNKELIYLACGAVIGAATGALVVDKLWQKHFEVELEVEARRIRLDYARHYSAPEKPSLDELATYAELDAAATMSVFGPSEDVQEDSEAEHDDISERHHDYTQHYTADEDHPIIELKPGAQDMINQAQAQKNDILAELVESPEPVEHNAFIDFPNPPGYEDREGKDKYILSTEEFMHEMKPDDDWTEVTMTYFAEDDTLIEDGANTQTVDIDDLIGAENVQHFGWNPKDKDTIHVRNMSAKIDFEITRDNRSYTEVVLGIKEFEDDAPRRMRPEDD